MTRRLAAIIAADVVGYSALMSGDESGTLARLIEFRKTLFDPKVTTHNGRIVKLMGDGALVEFASVVDAVACAVAIQSELASDASIQLRIGINLGDVIVEGSDIYGDGVNIAARLEAMTEPGGICVSQIVHQSVGNRVSAHFMDAGEHMLKNMTTPIRVYRWSPDEAGPSPRTESAPAKNDRPSIAVLAFDNMSADPDQEYFSDGIAEDIITHLSHFREFMVIARNSSFTYKGRSIRVDEVCRDLDVRYLLEGSVRKSGNRVRVTAQLIDGANGAHLWAEKFDRDLDDIFTVQDEITHAIVSAVAPETLEAELKRSRVKPPENLTAWDKVLQARWHLGKFNRADNDAARVLLEQAIAADPEMSDAYSAVAQCDLMAALHVWCDDIAATQQSARNAARRAVELDDQNAAAHGILGMAAYFTRDFDNALLHLLKAIELNPNLAIGHGNIAAYFGVSGEYEQSREAAELALKLSPRDPLRAFWYAGSGIGAYIASDYQQCLNNALSGLSEFPGFASLMRQEAAALAMLGRLKEANQAVGRLLQKMPGQTLAQVRQIVPVRHPDDHERWLEGLRRAGLPE